MPTNTAGVRVQQSQTGAGMLYRSTQGEIYKSYDGYADPTRKYIPAHILSSRNTNAHGKVAPFLLIPFPRGRRGSTPTPTQTST
jgi:hypothetical protein